MSDDEVSKAEAIYKIYNSGYTYKMIGELLGYSKQYIYLQYCKYERNHEDRLDKTCAICGEHKQNVTTLKRIPLCLTCKKIIARIKANKWKRDHEKV